MELNGKRVLIVGMAKSGIASAILCKQLGAQVLLYDGKEETYFEELLSSLEGFDFKTIFGAFNESILLDFDLMVLSPGVPTDLPFILKASDLGLEVIGEIELAYRYCKAPIVAITGTNGKTTTTALLGEIMKAHNSQTFVVGNIGNPFTSEVLNASPQGIFITEMSSFQLETIKTFHPVVSAILNLTEDHLNRHKTFQNYIDAKLRITQNQEAKDFCVLNEDDALCIGLSHQIKAKIIRFSMTKKVEGVYYLDGSIYLNMLGIEQCFISMEEIFLFGKHNTENIMAAVAMSLCVGVPLDIIKKVVSEFKGVEHRIEFVTEVRGIKFYNDSKATNPDSAIAAIRAMRTPTVLIGGGMDKGNTVEEWWNAFDGKIKGLVLFGETKYLIQETARKCHFNPVILVNTLEEAVCEAVKLAEVGDSVLLSPACASWDMFTSYEERGDLFKELVKKL